MTDDKEHDGEAKLAVGSHRSYVKQGSSEKGQCEELGTAILEGADIVKAKSQSSREPDGNKGCHQEPKGVQHPQCSALQPRDPNPQHETDSLIDAATIPPEVQTETVHNAQLVRFTLCRYAEKCHNSKCLYGHNGKYPRFISKEERYKENTHHGKKN